MARDHFYHVHSEHRDPADFLRCGEGHGNAGQSLGLHYSLSGGSRFRIYYTVFLPNAKAPMVLLGTGTFIGCWNSYVWPTLTLTSVDKWQIMQVIRSFRSTYSEAYGVVMAASLLSAIPPLIVFLIFQKHIIKGMLISGIK